jgi:hypothetical protein
MIAEAASKKRAQRRAFVSVESVDADQAASA